MSVIRLENVGFMYPRAAKYALEGINLSVSQGEFLAVMGENGAGKTTFCKLLNGIIPHVSGGNLSGKVEIDGVDTKNSSVPQLAVKVGMTLDDPDAQLFTSSVREEAAFGLQNILLPPDEMEVRIKQALEAVGLMGFEDREPATLSGGEKQRLAIAAVLAMQGKILVLDEPLCRLDPQGARELMSVLNGLRKNKNITVIMTTHDSAKAAEFADRVCVLKNGKITAIDTAKNIFSNGGLLKENGIQPITDNFTNFIPQNKICDAPVISVKNLSFSYSNGSGIKNIDLEIANNDFVAVTGGNGCGKTTILKCITGLLRPSEGDISICGKDIKKLSVSDISKEIGFVMQNPNTQLFTDSVYKEIAFALKNMRLSKTEIKQRAEAALKTAGLNDADAFPPALSRSDKAKTLIACVLAMGCKIIIFDEIDAGNDYSDSLKIMDIARDLHSRGFTIIFVTHNMFLAGEYAHRLIKMEKDRIVFDGRRED
jgi:energy-coupling factor transport system ATP-binding protein